MGGDCIVLSIVHHRKEPGLLEKRRAPGRGPDTDKISLEHLVQKARKPPGRPVLWVDAECSFQGLSVAKDETLRASKRIMTVRY